MIRYLALLSFYWRAYYYSLSNIWGNICGDKHTLTRASLPDYPPHPTHPSVESTKVQVDAEDDNPPSVQLGRQSAECLCCPLRRERCESVFSSRDQVGQGGSSQSSKAGAGVISGFSLPFQGLKSSCSVLPVYMLVDCSRRSNRKQTSASQTGSNGTN